MPRWGSPPASGGASKAVDLQLDHTKAYRATLKLGARTDTGDVTGTVLETAPVTAGEKELLEVLPRFVGPRMQTPPMYSAVKINGQPLYKLARQGMEVERKARPIEILSIQYEGSPAENEYTLTVKCSKGTYIRVLLEEIAEAMGQKGTMSALRRVAAGVYTEADAHSLEEDPGRQKRGPRGPAGPDAAGGERVHLSAAAGGGRAGGAAPVQWLPYQPLPRCGWPLPGAERAGPVPRPCQHHRGRAPGGKALCGAKLKGKE